jgi:hypothetical protein
MSRTSLFKEISSGTAIPEGKLAYFRERQRDRIYDLIMDLFLKRNKADGLTKADIARIINKNPSQITRWFSNPSNWTLDTISDLMLAISKGEIEFSESKFSNIKKKNCTQMDNLETAAMIVSSTEKSSITIVRAGY